MTGKLKRVAWTFWFDNVALLCSLLYCAWNWLSGHVPSERAPTLYWLVVLNNNLGCSLAIILALGLLVLIVIRIRRKSDASFLLIAGILVVAGSIIPFVASTRHLDRAELGGHVYYLALESNFELEYNFVACECDSRGLYCQCHGFYYTKQTPGRQLAHFVVNPTTSELKVQVDDEILYNVLSRCYYGNLYPTCSEK